jgi:hypothetical protein
MSHSSAHAVVPTARHSSGAAAVTRTPLAPPARLTGPDVTGRWRRGPRNVEIEQGHQPGPGHPQAAPQAHHRQALPLVGGQVPASQGVGGAPADAQHRGGLLHGEHLGQLLQRRPLGTLDEQPSRLTDVDPIAEVEPIDPGDIRYLRESPPARLEPKRPHLGPFKLDNELHPGSFACRRMAALAPHDHRGLPAHGSPAAGHSGGVTSRPVGRAAAGLSPVGTSSARASNARPRPAHYFGTYFAPGNARHRRTHLGVALRPLPTRR